MDDMMNMKMARYNDLNKFRRYFSYEFDTMIINAGVDQQLIKKILFAADFMFWDREAIPAKMNGTSGYMLNHKLREYGTPIDNFKKLFTGNIALIRVENTSTMYVPAFRNIPDADFWDFYCQIPNPDFMIKNSNGYLLNMEAMNEFMAQ